MTPAEWIGLGMLAATVLGLVWGAFTWLIDLILKQSKDTIAELKDDRNQWRTRALECEGRRGRE